MVKILLILMFMFSFVFATVNINKANSAQLQTLNGIGPSKANEIIKYRKAHGSFKTVEGLVDVKGIGPRTMEHLKSQVSVH